MQQESRNPEADSLGSLEGPTFVFQFKYLGTIARLQVELSHAALLGIFCSRDMPKAQSREQAGRGEPLAEHLNTIIKLMKFSVFLFLPWTRKS